MKEGKYTDIICKRFCGFYKEGKEELRCGAYAFLGERYAPEDIGPFLKDIGGSPDFSADKAVYELVCGRCEFVAEGCDYRAGLESPPCGGYTVVEYLIKTGVLAERDEGKR